MTDARTAGGDTHRKETALGRGGDFQSTAGGFGGAFGVGASGVEAQHEMIAMKSIDDTAVCVRHFADKLGE